MKNMFLFALISATLFACTPIENEPNACPPATDTITVTGTTPVGPAVWQSYSFGFYLGKTYTVTIYSDGETPEQETIVFLNQNFAQGEGALFATYWDESGVELVLNPDDSMWSEHFIFNYNEENDNLVCNKTPELTIVISKP